MRDWQLPAIRQGRPADPDLTARRAALVWPETAAPGLTVSETSVGGVRCVSVGPSDPLGTLIHLHGGGYRLGSPETWTPFAARVALDADVRVLVPDYRLAPEHPFPAALHDVVAVFDAVATTAATPLVSGDSAGGGLAAALVVAARPNRRPLPAALVLLSPWVDLTVQAASYASREPTDRLFSPASAREAADAYLQGVDNADPLASPLFADLTGFPPALVLAGGDEVLLDDALRLAARLATAGGSVDLHVAAGMQHVWPIAFPDLPESAAAHGVVAGFIRSHTGAGGGP